MDEMSLSSQLALKKKAPASIRLMDNDQFQFGRALKPGAASFLASFLDHLKTLYVTKIKGFGATELSVATLLFEGTKEEVAQQQKDVFEIAAQYNGISGGEGRLAVLGII